MKTPESEKVYKDGEWVTMYKVVYDGIFTGQEGWFSQKTMDRLLYQERQEREGRRLKKVAREREQYPYGKSSFFV